ncbi:NMCC_0638 family (lipo)protein [Rhodopila sp.]|uniref:NMCC_0638 family (lipo)protein n=1 Tax=Rhodopila sp. TaxID=2480087 RepID=UPI003D0EE383
MAALLVAALVAPATAHADAAQELAGLFMQSCLPYAGDPAGLRGWAKRIGLPHAAEQARVAFLHGAPGEVFDGSNAVGKFVLVSSDDGICSALTDQSTQQPAIDALETDLRQGGIAFRLVIERDDKNIPAIHDREYLATKNGRSWRILLATVKGDKGGQAMITGAPE